MLIKKFKASGYRLLESTGIKKLEIDFTSPIVIIIGTNGCGKSSLLRALTPFTQNKNVFHKNAAVDLTIEHNNKEYELGVRFDDKQPYYFQEEENINLNESGNSGSYNELAEHKFHFTPELDKLTRMEYKMSRIGKAQRKEFLMFFNPYNLEMIFDFEKKIGSTLRSIKNNIKLISQRKSVLEDKSIKEEELIELRNRVNDLKKDYELFDKASTVANIRVKELQSRIVSLINSNPKIVGKTMDDYMDYFDKLIEDMRLIWKEEKDTFHEAGFISENHVIDTLTRLKTEIGSLSLNIQEKIQKLTDYESYNTLDLDKEITPRKERLKNIENHLESFVKIDNIPEISKGNVEELIMNVLPELILILHQLNPYSGKILTTTQLNKVASKLDFLQSKYSYQKGKLVRYEQEKVNIQKAILTVQSDSFPMDCNHNKCGLKNNVEFKLAQLEKELSEINIAIEILTKKQTKLEKTIDRLFNINETGKEYTELLSSIRTINSNHSWLLPHLSEGKKFVDLLNRSIFSLTMKVQKLKTYIEEYGIIINLTDERKTLLFELGKLENPNIPVKNLLQDMISNIKHEIFVMQNKHADFTNQIRLFEKYQIKSKAYSSLFSNLGKLNETYLIWFDYISNQKRLEFFQYIDNFLTNSRDEIKEALFKNEVLLQEQENYRLILEKEILPVLKDLEEKEKEYDLIHKSLSSADGIPKNYLVNYLNNIINNANLILSQTWSYELQLVPLNKHDDIDFLFKRIVNGEVASDISLCSESQRDIIDIAWSLSMIITLGYGKDYPIYFDESDKHFDEGHRERLISLINNQIHKDNIRQVFLVNHHAALSSGLNNSQTICLSSHNISLPETYNENVILHYS